MSLTLYFAPNSTASITAAVLAELAVPHAVVRLDIDAGDTRRPEFLALNPNGRVPVLVDAGVPIWESAAITLYLAELYGSVAGLYPAPGPRRGEAMTWIAWASTKLSPAGGLLAAALPTGTDGAVQAGSADWLPPDQRPDEARARAALARCLGVLEQGLAGKDYLLGAYSLADTHLFGFVGWIAGMAVPLPPGVAAWLERCAQRPALAAME
jgi:glutathione S-transferase